MQERHPVGFVEAGVSQHQCRRRGPLVRQRKGAGDSFMRAISRNEVDQRNWILHVQREIDPACVRSQLRVTGTFEEGSACLVQRWNASVSSTSQIDRRQVQRQAEQIVAQRLGDKLVDLVAHLTRHAANDRTRGFIRGQSAVLIEFERIQERLDQPDFAGRKVGI
ncbi:hypothetical protein D3C77_165700 [compost metagenome]